MCNLWRQHCTVQRHVSPPCPVLSVCSPIDILYHRRRWSLESTDRAARSMSNSFVTFTAPRPSLSPSLSCCVTHLNYFVADQHSVNIWVLITVTQCLVVHWLWFAMKQQRKFSSSRSVQKTSPGKSKVKIWTHSKQSCLLLTLCS